MNADQFLEYIESTGGVDLALYAATVMEQARENPNVTLDEELEDYARYRGFKVLSVGVHFPPEVDPFVPLRRAVVDIWVRRNEQDYTFGNSLCMHPSISLKQVVESPEWRYALLQPVKRQLWEASTHNDRT